MRKYLEIIGNTPLFHDIGTSELESMLGCLDATTRKYDRHESVFLAGDPAIRVGIVLDGAVQVSRDDIFGNHTILTTLGPKDMFGETFACAGVDTLPVGVTATSKSTILLVDYRKIITTCSSSCTFHNRMIENMLRILAQKNLGLNQKIEAVSAHTTREKLLVYLNTQASRAGRSSFAIPFNRQELADYLAVDRSALSAELGKMRDEGVLRFHKNQFELLEQGG